MADSIHPAASLAEIVQIHGIRNWIEQSYEQVKDELGWADFQVRSDTAVRRRYQVLVKRAFSFSWDTWFTGLPPDATAAPQPEPGRGERGAARRHPVGPILAAIAGAICAWLSPGPRCSAGGPHGPKPSPPAAASLIDSVTAGHGLNPDLPP